MNSNELSNVKGGFSYGLWGTAGLIIAFVLGFFEGLVNPVRCGK